MGAGASGGMSGMRIAVIPGDGVGQELLPRCLGVLALVGIDFEAVELEAGWETFEKYGQALPQATLEEAAACDAIVFGAVSSPSRKVAGYSSPILELRKSLDLYANLRPAISSPVATSREGVDFLIVRENTEGLYAGRERVEGDQVIAERVISRKASLRIARRAFLEARSRLSEGRSGRLTIVHKANVLPLSDGLFRDCALEVEQDFPDIEVEEQLIDSMIYRMIREPERYGVILAPNLYGDILSDAAGALVGGLGLLPSANIGDAHLLVEPVHGSAPDIAGRGLVNPVATLRALALLLAHRGHGEEERRISAAIERCLREGPTTPDLGGSATTNEMLATIEAELHNPEKEGS